MNDSTNAAPQTEAAQQSPMDFPAEMTITDPDTIVLLSNPTRLIVLEDLYERQQPQTATQLAQLAGVSPSSMSYHLRLLGKTGLIRRVPDAANRREAPWEASGRSFSFAVSQQPDASVRMRLMDGVLRTLRLRINATMEASAAVPISERRERYPFTPLSTGTLLLTREELLRAQQEIWSVWERYEKLSAQRIDAKTGADAHAGAGADDADGADDAANADTDAHISVAYAWSFLPTNPQQVGQPAEQ